MRFPVRSAVPTHVEAKPFSWWSPFQYFWRKTMSDDRRWPTGLTIGESEELHKHVIDGARVFFVISAIAHLLAYMYSPWLG